MGIATQSMARQSAIAQRNAAQAAMIKATNAQSSLIGSNMNPSAAAARETALEIEKERAATRAQLASATLKKNDGRKLNYFA